MPIECKLPCSADEYDFEQDGVASRCKLTEILKLVKTAAETISIIY